MESRINSQQNRLPARRRDGQYDFMTKRLLFCSSAVLIGEGYTGDVRFF